MGSLDLGPFRSAQICPDAAPRSAQMLHLDRLSSDLLRVGRGLGLGLGGEHEAREEVAQRSGLARQGVRVEEAEDRLEEWLGLGLGLGLGLWLGLGSVVRVKVRVRVGVRVGASPLP